MMNETARKYIGLFRQVKIATAATADAQGHPQARIINVMLAEDDGMYIVTSKGKPFYKNVCPVRKASFHRENRTAAGHEFLAGYQAALCL